MIIGIKAPQIINIQTSHHDEWGLAMNIEQPASSSAYATTSELESIFVCPWTARRTGLNKSYKQIQNLRNS